MRKERDGDTQGPEGARRATEGVWVSTGNEGGGGGAVDTQAGSGSATAGIAGAEVSDKPRRRRFTAEYKERILELVEGCKTPGSVGALLRREGLYSSTLSLWRRQRKEGGLTALDGKKRGRKGSDPVVIENQKLVKENQDLKEDLRKAELIIDIQKKVLQMMDSGK